MTQTARITVLPGDGIGPEIVAEGIKVLQAVASRFGYRFDLQEKLIGGAAIDAAGVPLPDDTLQACRASDAVLLGAVGGPRWDQIAPEIRPERGLLAIRKQLGLYANVRPVKVHPATVAASPLRPELVEHVDLVVIRELTGGIYFGDKFQHTENGETRATDVCTYTSTEIERIIRVAAHLARQRRHTLTSVDKANVLETSRLWRSIATRIMHDEFPDVAFDHMLVDACAMHLIKRPGDFDVIVTENMFGDILTDEASILAGSIGLLPSASLGDAAQEGDKRLGLYEPIHGSAPDIAGRGIANPIGTIMSVAMLLRHSLTLDEAASCVEGAVSATIAGGYLTPDLHPASPQTTAEVGSRIAQYILQETS